MRNTKHIKDRRPVRFASVDELLADAESLHRDGYEQLGNWTLGQNCEHLALAMEYSVKGFPIQPPLWIRLARPFIRRSVRKNGLPQGVPLKGNLELLVPKCQSDDEGLTRLHDGVALLKRDTTRHPSPVLGDMTVDEWNRFHCQHGELHLSFLRPR